MKTFLCKTVTSSGQILKEIIRSEDIGFLQKEFEKKGIFVLEIKQQNELLEFIQNINPFKSKVKLEDVILFSKELSILIQSGLPLISCLSALLEHSSNKKLKEIILNIKKDVEGGMPLSESLSKHPGTFSKFYTTSIKSGESTDNLIEVLNKMSEYYKVIATLRRKVISALIYPSFLIILAGFAITYLLMFVVPVFAKLYSELGQNLPFLTRAIIKVSGILKSSIVFMVLLIISSWYYFKYINKTITKSFMDKLKLKIPVFNEILKKYFLSHLCRTISMLLRSGVSLIKSLEISSEMIDNKIIANKIRNVSKEVIGGTSLALAFKNTNIIPALTIEMVHTGEQTGALEEMLDNTADIYEEDVNSSISSLLSVIEPIMMLIMGILVAGILLSMYLPIFELSARF